MIIVWDQGAYAPPYSYYGLGYTWNWAGTLGASVVATPHACITLAEVSRLSITLAEVSRIDITLVEVEC